MRGPTLILLPLAALSLQGCLAKAALDVATAPETHDHRCVGQEGHAA